MKNGKILALVLCLLIAGCASNVVKSEVDREYRSRYDYGERVGLWFVDRFNDFFDIFQADLSFGPGLSPTWPLVNVHATEFAEAGVGWFEGTKVGLKERSFGVWEEKRKEYGLGPFYSLDVHRVPVAGTKHIFDQAYDYTGWDLLEAPTSKEDERHWLDFGAGVHLLVLGADVNFGTFEAADFILGLNPIELLLRLFNYDQPITDFMHDDTWSRVRTELEKTKGLGGE